MAFALNAQPYVRGHTIPSENVRDQARYVATHAKPDDVTLVNLSSNWGFAYYWPIGHPSRRPSAAVLNGYEAYFTDQLGIVVARDRNAAGVDAAVTEARTQALKHQGARIWLIRTHVLGFEMKAWDAALNEHGLTAKSVGHDGLSLVQVS